MTAKENGEKTSKYTRHGEVKKCVENVKEFSVAQRRVIYVIKNDIWGVLR